MCVATTTLTSFDEFERLEFGADEVELLKGVVIRMPTPFNDHMDLCEDLYERLKSAVEHLRASYPDVRPESFTLGVAIDFSPICLRGLGQMSV